VQTGFITTVTLAVMAKFFAGFTSKDRDTEATLLAGFEYL
jgi:hypothetical protein